MSLIVYKKRKKQVEGKIKNLSLIRDQRTKRQRKKESAI